MDMKLEVVVVRSPTCTGPGTSTRGWARRLDAGFVTGPDFSEVFPDAGGVFHHAGTQARMAGPAPGHKSYGSWVSFTDPDGNSWFVQEVTACRAGRHLCWRHLCWRHLCWRPMTRWRAWPRRCACGGRARQARGGDRAARPGLAGPVRSTWRTSGSGR